MVQEQYLQLNMFLLGYNLKTCRGGGGGEPSQKTKPRFNQEKVRFNWDEYNFNVLNEIEVRIYFSEILS